MNCTILIPIVVIVGLWKYRDDYCKYARTTKLGVFAIFAVFSMPNLVVGLFVPWIGFPETAVQAVGFFVLIVGLLLCLIPIVGFRSARKVVGMEPGGLDVSGLYRYSRNPQYLAYGLFLLGWVLCGTSTMACLGLVLYSVVVHLTILIEEEHLSKVYGEVYKRYRKTTPRYLF
jgi:protein-S-isoprenylcysteine O-methyltransferase Ste14